MNYFTILDFASYFQKDLVPCLLQIDLLDKATIYQKYSSCYQI